MHIDSIASLLSLCLLPLALAGALVPATASDIANPSGSAAPTAIAAREIKIDGAIKAVNVSLHEIVKFVNPTGQSCIWHFYTLCNPTIKLSTIAPAGFAGGEVLIYVGPGPDELN